GVSFTRGPFERIGNFCPKPGEDSVGSPAGSDSDHAPAGRDPDSGTAEAGSYKKAPSGAEIAEVLPCVDYRELSLSDHVLHLGQNQEIDLGGIAKGYASDCLMELFREYELTGAIVSLGGNVQCYGAKPDGSAWNVGIRRPFPGSGGQELLGILTAKSEAVITSGSYERYFTDPDTGHLWHHILDPSTGYPADSGLVSVTIICESGLRADALSTACFILGADKAADLWRSGKQDFDMILVCQDGSIILTAPAAERFTPGDAGQSISILE
ncbi:MAG TPA: hypothetical protein DEV97_02765, partial [Lachnospiraceae bacterium]|nr:hypothetical protein [Lachnospiraceae bacterium]